MKIFIFHFTLFAVFVSACSAPVKRAEFADLPKNQAVVQSNAPANQSADLNIKGNKNSKIYHMRGCPNYDDIAERNVIWFKTHEEAKAKGFRKAQNC